MNRENKNKYYFFFIARRIDYLNTNIISVLWVRPPYSQNILYRNEVHFEVQRHILDPSDSFMTLRHMHM